MHDDRRPDPDRLLQAISRSEHTSNTGKLRIYFGMAAGVGKTYAMLEAAQAKKVEGVDVAIGLVETHGRSETAALLKGLDSVPRQKIQYRGATFEEMDLDALLARKPQIAVVDELAHTNVPGSRHPKRWHDVVELLEAGIDVYTTLNVQHIESRKAMVELIGGIPVHETVPDALLERAAQIELVDITPADLLQRLAEGKVYLGEKAGVAAANFFREDRLTSLRELALRLTAEKVDSDLDDLLATEGRSDSRRPTDRLMVAVSHSPYSDSLIRSTRRIAFGLGVPWIAVHVETGAQLSADDRATLAANLRLVQELGGELVALTDTDIPAALERVARRHAITQMVVGRPTRSWRDRLTGGSIIDQLARLSDQFDILVLRPDTSLRGTRQRSLTAWNIGGSVRSYLVACITIMAVAGISALCLPIIGYRAVGFLFLLSVMGVSLFVSFGAVLAAALLSALIWDFFFIPPPGTLYIGHAEDVMMVLSYFVAALVTGFLTHRIRTRQQLIRQRQERTALLYDLAKQLVANVGIEKAVTALAQRVRPVLEGELDLLVAEIEGGLRKQPILKAVWMQNEKELAVAQWAHGHGRAAGWATDTLPSAVARYIPLRSSPGVALGVLAFYPEKDRKLTQDEENLLSAVAHQLSLSLERERLSADADNALRLKESERLLQTVVDSVSHELRTPLTAIAGTAMALEAGNEAADQVRRRELLAELLALVERLNRIVGNLLDMSRLSSGMMTLQKDWHDPRDLITAALEATDRELRGRQVKLNLEENLPLVRVDFRLMVQAIVNMVANAATHSPAASPIEVHCRWASNLLILEIRDYGSGVAATDVPHLFTKFYRAPGAPAGGVGLGLPIAKSIVEVHGGTLSLATHVAPGACFVIELPLEPQPDIPPEDEADEQG